MTKKEFAARFTEELELACNEAERVLGQKLSRNIEVLLNSGGYSELLIWKRQWTFYILALSASTVLLMSESLLSETKIEPGFLSEQVGIPQARLKISGTLFQDVVRSNLNTSSRQTCALGLIQMVNHSNTVFRPH